MIKKLCLGALLACALVSCSDESVTYDSYANWQSRNEAWFGQVCDSARTAIAKAKATYGDAWEEHCEWRQIKSLQRSTGYDSGKATDSICVKILSSGAKGGMMPYYNDTVRVSHRGWLMNTTYQNNDGTQYDQMRVFSQSYYGEFDAATCAPSVMGVAATVEGFSTALQYMVPGDDWMVYIPYQQGYGSSDKDVIPAYSTLLFRIHLAAVYRHGTGIPSWK